MNTQLEQCFWVLGQMNSTYVDAAWDYLTKQLATQRYEPVTDLGLATVKGWQEELQKVRGEAQKEVDWSLSADQTIYMLQLNNLIEAWSNGDQDAAYTVMDLATSKEFTDLFGDISFDEAHDRYQWMIEHGAKSG